MIHGVINELTGGIKKNQLGYSQWNFLVTILKVIAFKELNVICNRVNGKRTATWFLKKHVAVLLWCARHGRSLNMGFRCEIFITHSKTLKNLSSSFSLYFPAFSMVRTNEASENREGGFVSFCSSSRLVVSHFSFFVSK